MTDSDTLIRHEACPSCPSSDALAVYYDGHTHCFSCGYHTGPNGQPKETSMTTSASLLDVEITALKARKITEATCSKWGYGVSTYKGKSCQVATYCDQKGRKVAQKLRFADKTFKFLGDGKGAGLYGQHLWPSGGRRVVVTEGEIDALSVSQLQDNKWPVVSVKHGAQSAEKCIKESLKWLETFDNVVFCFDQDDPGKEAADKCAALLTPGKAKVASLPLKDANEMLKAGRGEELRNLLWQAREWRPEGIVTVGDIKEDILKEPEWGLSYPWESLTNYTYGMRLDELVGLGAGTGIGKSDFFKEIVTHLIVEHEQKVGVLFLEETPAHTAKCIMSKRYNKLFHLPGEDWTKEEFEEAEQWLEAQDRLYLFDHFGATDYETIKSYIRYMAVSLGCKYIFLDHITFLVTGDKDGDERKALDYIMTDLASLVRELHINIHFVSHLATPEGSPHEEGGRVKLRHLRGSRAIVQCSSFVMGLERNQQEPDSPTTVRILKDRYSGRATGKLMYLGYDYKTGRLNEVDEPDEAEEIKKELVEF